MEFVPFILWMAFYDAACVKEHCIDKDQFMPAEIIRDTVHNIECTLDLWIKRFAYVN